MKRQYRYLKPREIIQEGDEYLANGLWIPTTLGNWAKACVDHGLTCRRRIERRARTTRKAFYFTSQQRAACFVSACGSLSELNSHTIERTCERVETNLPVESCRKAARFAGIRLPDYHIVTVEDDDSSDEEPE